MSTRWCCRILQEEFGPMDFDELVELALSGTLGPGDLVRRETDDVWRAARKYPELRTAFAHGEHVAESLTARNEPSTRSHSETTARERSLKPPHQSDEPEPSEAVTAGRLQVPTSPRQRWIAWSSTAGWMLVLFFADRLIASATPTFPQPRRMREQLAGLHWFLGTGPWSHWEYWLLWLDSLILLAFASAWLARRLTR